jgi:parvulin-like peptidyl-prolyl isomerase
MRLRPLVRFGMIASVVAGLASVADAQGPTSKAGNPAGPATKAATPPRPAILDQVLANVNGETITREELYRIFNQVGVPPGAESEQDVYRIGLEGLVNSKLVKQYLAKQKALDVTEKEVDAEFADFEKKLKADGQDVRVALASHGITIPQVREDMKSALRWRKYLDAVATDANLKKFVASNQDVFNRTQVRASHIVVRVEPDAPAADKEKARQKLLGIKKEIDAGKITFADAANKFSEDDGNKSSPSGGDLGFFLRRGQFNEQFTTAAFALKKATVSEPVETPFGYHLILVTDRNEGTPVDFEQQKLLIRNEYASDLHERIVAAERKTAKIKVEPMPADLFPKAPPQQPGGAPTSPGAAPASPGGAAAPK